MSCKNCNDPITQCDHAKYGTAGYCCDCADLLYGMPLEKLNLERVAKGKEPIKKVP